jgi:hypothetical protein
MSLLLYLVSNVDRVIRFCRSFLLTMISMSTSGVATLRNLLARSSAASRTLLSAGAPGGLFSVGAGVRGALPSLSSPMAASALSVGVFVFRAGDDRCRGLIGLFNVVSGTAGSIVCWCCVTLY